MFCWCRGKFGTIWITKQNRTEHVQCSYITGNQNVRYFQVAFNQLIRKFICVNRKRWQHLTKVNVLESNNCHCIFVSFIERNNLQYTNTNLQYWIKIFTAQIWSAGRLKQETVYLKVPAINLRQCHFCIEISHIHVCISDKIAS